MLVHQFVEHHARQLPDSPCLTAGDHTTSYGEMDALGKQLIQRYANS